MKQTSYLLLIFFTLLTNHSIFAKGNTPIQNIYVTDYLPQNYVTDGSVNYREYLQKAIDSAIKMKLPLVFPAMQYLVDEQGLKIGSNLTITMYGAVFIVDEKCDSDGQVFIGNDIKKLNLFGGEISGRNDKWKEGVNIRGILISGQSDNIRIKDMYIHDLTSNGIGLFGEEESPISDVWVTDTYIDNCCNFYGDYESDKPGTEPGSVREDQGSVAFYYVNDFTVRGCRFERSRSDGTHFYKCKRGQFTDNKVYSAQMGGYFLEGCMEVTAANNIIKDNGSRGVTIERGSFNCTLIGNVVSNSGRQGLWAPNSAGLTVTGNIFDKNGRKPNGNTNYRIWNANITVNAASDPSNTYTRDYLIADNIIYTTADQIAAVHIDADKSRNIIIKNNLLQGENRTIKIDGKNDGSIVIEGNE
ncbi:MAG: right-handed parallel beta-helix repeat-containing protein [Draconibacterium sp.]